MPTNLLNELLKDLRLIIKRLKKVRKIYIYIV